MSGIHKDFHGIHSFILEYVQERYGDAFLEKGLRRIGQIVYAPVAKNLAKQGLDYLEEYWREIFEAEDGEISTRREGETLVLEVKKCPAIAHLHAKGMPVARRFCDHTRIINEEICRAAGYESDVEYDQQHGRCVQRFRKRRSGKDKT